MSAAEGKYGAPSYDKTALYAAAMLDAIKQELSDASYFTREDLLHLSCFAHVATITRYQYVCKAVRYAVERKWMLEITRTDIILTGKKRDYAASLTHVDEYEATVIKLLPPVGQRITLPQLLLAWHAKSDHHLTENVKRTYLRTILRTLVRREVLSVVSITEYERLV